MSWSATTLKSSKRCVCIIAFLVLLPGAGHAEFLGLIAGREATPAKSSNLSVELGFVTGRFSNEDFQNIAARVHYRLTPALLASGSAGIGEYGRTDGVPYGLGLMYHLSNQRISEQVEIAARASYHYGEYSVRESDGDLKALALEVLVSGAQPLTNNGLSWYSNIGYHRITLNFNRSDSSSELGIAAGLVLPTGLGEAYVGLEHIDELSFGLGIRYFVQ